MLGLLTNAVKMLRVTSVVRDKSCAYVNVCVRTVYISYGSDVILVRFVQESRSNSIVHVYGSPTNLVSLARLSHGESLVKFLYRFRSAQ